ncbi:MULTISPECIES: SHOCT domain-containing protein [unclassified Streptomyces]|uniref:SHOCT domain-containing protein n=1 Tax=Streptomycetaceae TaxID=2062 RepID=UPI002E7A7A49|nr:MULTISPECIES: SHOCT domain-containing protein [unclassified Streptomyces]MED7951259.1 SHOCT domain-containing protein [Streptomyces sp. BE303]MEE1826446.1 SHOCT domain-containing protein [Streptomyces sp. BE20]
MQSTATLLADTVCREGWGPWGGGPGPWFLIFPLFWLLVLVVVVTTLRRRGGAGRGPWGPPWAGGPWGGGPGWRGGWPGGPEGPLASLARRYAEGQITEEEYRIRRDTLLEHLEGPDDTKPGRGGAK